MDIPIAMPRLERIPGNLMETLNPLSCGSNEFLSGSLVKRDASNTLAACVSDDTSCLGWSPGPSTNSTDRRPEVFWDRLSNTPGGPYPYRLNGAELVMNITDGSGNVGEADSAPQLNDVTVGQAYNLYRWTSGDYEGMQAVNIDGTGSTLVTVVEKLDDGSAYNGRVRVRIPEAKIQL